MFSFLKSSKVSTQTENDQKGSHRGLATRWRDSLAASRAKFGTRLNTLFSSAPNNQDDLLEEIETILLSSDVGVAATERIMVHTKQTIKQKKISNNDEIKEVIKNVMLELLLPMEGQQLNFSEKPAVVLVAGVNGAGKTTTIGKLAAHLVAEGKSVFLAAGDTFRAAAEDQLKVWGERSNIVVISQEKGDSSAVIYDAIQSGLSKGADVVIADTAGRLATQKHLMEELKKVKRVMGKAMISAPHEVLLVVDANTGQNAIDQVKSFDEALGITGIILTKLDGSAKGGAVFGIAQYKPIPLLFVGLGEKIDDLKPFDALEFVNAIFDS